MDSREPRQVFAYAVAAIVVTASCVLGALLDTSVNVSATAVLLVLAILGDLAAARLAARVMTAATGAAMYLAAVRFGALDALIVAGGGQLGSFAISRYRPVALASNLAAFLAPVVLAAAVAELAADTGSGSLTWLWAGAAATAAGETLNIGVACGLISLYDGQPLRTLLRSQASVVQSYAYESVFVGVLAAAAAKSEELAVGLVTLETGVYAYMGHLVAQEYAQRALAEQRARRLGELSYGVLSSLVATLAARDPRAGRHLAGVARYSRDLARQVGLDEEQQDLAHTAGLLHDIGRFALSDRVLNAEDLSDDDWELIYEHPERGAELVRDLDSYGPIAEIIGAHHERVDGQGYPAGLREDEIPLLSRIVAVCEVYDTLTAPDTYRPRTLSSFEALNELRSVAGTQLDADLVEAFATMLAGTDTGYRHADDVDYAAELHVQRAILERVAGPAPLA